MNKFTVNLITFLRENYFPEEKVKESKDGKTTIFFRKAGKALCYIETKGSESSVTIVIGSTLEDRAVASNLSPKTKKKFQQAKSFHDGKWLSFDLASDYDLSEVKELIQIKRALK